MSEFELFNEALVQYKKAKPITDKTQSDESESESESDNSSCIHENVITEKGANVCIDCGVEIQRKITHNKEWRFYGQTDTRRVSNPNRVQMRKSETRSIFSDVENLNFSENIVSKANELYTKVTNGKIFRGNSRKAIVFACIFHAYKLTGKPQSHDKLVRIFNLTHQTGLKGLKHVSLYAPIDSEIRTTYITPVNLIEEIMDQFSASKNHKQEVIKLYNSIKNKRSRLNRSRPQSIAAGLVYYWFCKEEKGIDIKEFTKKVELSELTIVKIAREIANVLGTEDII